MRRVAAWGLAGCGAVGLAGAAPGQSPQAPQTVTVAPAPFQMPGTAVGTPIVKPVGNQLPRAGQQVGAKVGTGPGGVPAALNPGGPRPSGQPLDLGNVIAPYPGQPKPAPSFWDKLEQRWASLFQSTQPAQRTTNWTPGIARRNRERAHERAMRRD